MRKKIVAGNWKMNTLPAEGVELAKNIVAGRGEVCSCVNFIVCPPFTHLSTVAEALKGSDVALGAQDCATEAKGAYTGEIAASMIAALGCKYVILGHSERRQYYGETSETLNKKMVPVSYTHLDVYKRQGLRRRRRGLRADGLAPDGVPPHDQNPVERLDLLQHHAAQGLSLIHI